MSAVRPKAAIRSALTAKVQLKVVLRTSLTEDSRSFVITVRDNGCGMSEEIKRNIFTPFFSTKDTLGTGLGLAVTARIIAAHDGSISVDSEPDRGTAFFIHLPTDGPSVS